MQILVCKYLTDLDGVSVDLVDFHRVDDPQSQVTEQEKCDRLPARLGSVVLGQVHGALHGVRNEHQLGQHLRPQREDSAHGGHGRNSGHGLRSRRNSVRSKTI